MVDPGHGARVEHAALVVGDVADLYTVSANSGSRAHGFLSRADVPPYVP
jgi:hypothetical protein